MKKLKNLSTFLVILAILATIIGIPQPVSASTQYLPASINAVAIFNTTTQAPNIRISWPAAAGASGYKIYRASSESGTYSLIKTVSGGTNFTDTNVQPNTFYYYKLKAYHKFFWQIHESAMSAPVKAMYVTASRINLSTKNCVIEPGTTVNLAASPVGSIAPYRPTVQKITFWSNNTSAATVDARGIISGIQPGAATITATLTDAYGRIISTSCSVNVQYTYRNPLPAGTYRVSSEYGWRTPITTSSGTSSSFHAGIDLATATPTAVYATRPGKVVATGFGESIGNFITIYHPEVGLYSTYGHLSSIKVSKDQYVTKASIGTTGTTGASTGIHLHFAISRTPNFWSQIESINPRSYVTF